MVGFSEPQKNSLDFISRVKVHLHYLHINEFPKEKGRSAINDIMVSYTFTYKTK